MKKGEGRAVNDSVTNDPGFPLTHSLADPGSVLLGRAVSGSAQEAEKSERPTASVLHYSPPKGAALG